MRRIQLIDSEHIVAAVVAVGIGLLALSYGGNPPEATATIAILSWWAVALGVATELLPLSRLGRTAWIGAGLIGGITVLTALSSGWASDQGRAIQDTVQMLAITGVFVLCLITARRGAIKGWVTGMAIGLGVIVGLAILSRYFPGIGDDAELSRNIGGVSGRLSWPLGYWNALGTCAAMLLCLLVWLGSESEKLRYRVIASGAMPIVVLVLYLTSSRGAALALLLGLAAMVVFAPNRGRMLSVIGIGLIAGVILSLIASSMYALVHAEGGADGRRQGWILLANSILFVAAVCVLRSWSDSRLRELRLPRIPRWFWAVPAVLAVAAIVAVNPVERIDSFTAKPAPIEEVDGNSTNAHLMSGGGNGRWQLWNSAIDAWETKPFTGIGSGGFQTWFSENGDLPTAVRHSHSLPFQVLAELGTVGILLLLGFAGLVTGTAIVRWRSGRTSRRISLLVGNREPWPDQERQMSVAAFAGVIVAGFFGLAIDWSGEFPAVTVPIMISAAAILGPTLATRPAPLERRDTLKAVAVTVCVVLVSGAAIWVSSMSYGAENHLKDSRTAVDNGNLPLARQEALDSIEVMPSLAPAYIQLALVEEMMGRYGPALAAAREGTLRSPDTGNYWFLRARIAVQAGRMNEARLATGRGIQLDPKNPIVNKVRS